MPARAPTPAIRVLLTGAAPNGDTLDLVVYPDNTCGLLRNSQSLPGLRRPLAEMEHCTAAMLDLAGVPR